VKEYIVAVGKILWALLLGSALITVVAIPRGKDRELVRALQELRFFRAGFNQKALENSLYSHASARYRVPVRSITSLITGENAPTVSASRDAPAIDPWAKIDLSTLGSIYMMGKSDASVRLGLIKPGELAAGIEWRLIQRKEEQSYQLVSVRLDEGNALPEDVALEQRVVSSRHAAVQAKEALKTALDTAAKANDTFEKWRKWKAPWKVLQKALDARKKAQAEAEDAQRVFDQNRSQYYALAKQAQQFPQRDRAGKAATKVAKTNSSREGDYAIAVAAIKASPSGASFDLRVPVALESRVTDIPHLTGCDFYATRAAKLWPVVSRQSVQKAIASVEKRFSWRYRYLNMGSIKIGGMTLLQLAPLVLLGLLLRLLVLIRKARSSYNPFGAKIDWTALPAVGLKFTVVNFAAIVLMPLIACIMCIVSLVWIDELPVVPILSFCGALALGIYAYGSFDELRHMRDEVTRSHSVRPPAEEGP
jgi:hypothetical protein